MNSLQVLCDSPLGAAAAGVRKARLTFSGPHFAQNVADSLADIGDPGELRQTAARLWASSSRCVKPVFPAEFRV